MDWKSIRFIYLSCKIFMRWRHDDMMQCKKNKRAGTNETHGETRNIWKSSRASVSGHYNTPALREDLVSRSRMAPKGKRKRKRRGKTKLLLWQRSETKEPSNVEHIERKNATEINEVESIQLRERNKKEPIWVALWLKRDARLDRMKRTWAEDTTLRING